MSGRWFRSNFHVQCFLRFKIQESHINHRSELSGDLFHEWALILSKFSCRVFWDLLYKRATTIKEVSFLEINFMIGPWFCPIFLDESFLRFLVQKSHINHRSELSGDHFHVWRMISSKLSWREFLEIYKTKEPHQSQKWAIWRPFSWVGDDFVQNLMSRVS